MREVSQWFQGLPLLTRYWFGLTVLFTILGRFNYTASYYSALLYEPLVHQLQIWRPVTSLFWYPLSPSTGFHFMVNLYFLYSYSLRMETTEYGFAPAEYLTMLLFNWLNCFLIALFMGYPMLMDMMVMSVMYVWCQLNRDVIVSFWFGTQFRAMYLPWVIMLMGLVVFGGGVEELFGILVGHLYYFLVFKYPQEFGGPVLLSTPNILRRFLPDVRQGSTGFGSPPGRAAASGARSTEGSTSWGVGRRLDD